MIARNEGHQIARAINSVLPIVDEVIVVDTGSVDDTVKAAESLGAKVHFHQWNDNFSQARWRSLKFPPLRSDKFPLSFARFFATG